jgi:hypothetical protein
MQVVDEGFESMLEDASRVPPAPPPPSAPIDESTMETTVSIPGKGVADTLVNSSVSSFAPVYEPPPPSIPLPPALLARRVAVVAGPDGAARIIPLDETSPPEGAVAAILVPLSAADGEPLARLLRGRRS